MLQAQAFKRQRATSGKQSKKKKPAMLPARVL